MTSTLRPASALITPPVLRSIDRLLIANRGEIAVRIARTAHRLGIGTVGVYTEQDRHAVHVDSVDVAVGLGDASSTGTYLDAAAIIAAALDTGCDAIHPGYGFLAENAEFAQRVIDAGLVWVGPRPEQIAVLGDKLAAKRAVVEAGVPTTAVIHVEPGTSPPDVPLPALIKAVFGGGGRGMRVVRTAAELPAAIAAASREAASAFGDGAVFIEPYIEHGRHIEVQILGDAHGNVIHLGERDCSLQRRNQKVVEESPAAGISDATRAALLDGALALARHVGYESAGTVEFLVGPDATITFLEVNTRLQVEHPVTEAVTGLDLVELQLLVATGAPLPITQDDVRITGHAIEVRLVAEDPAAGWLPSTGTVSTFAMSPDVRVDAGVRAGSVISPDYDSLIAKVIAHAPTRRDAARRLARALRTSNVAGIRTNLSTSIAILEEEDFLAATTSTAYFAEHPGVLVAGGAQGDDRIALLLGAVFAIEQLERTSNPAPSAAFAVSGWRNLRTVGQRQRWRADGDADPIGVEHTFRNADRADVLLGDFPLSGADGTIPPDERRRIAVRLLDRSPWRQVVELDGRRHAVSTYIAADARTVVANSPAGTITWTRPPRFVDHERASVGSGPLCPLPGTVLAVLVQIGQAVDDGTALMVVEAMKMEHTISATAPALVEEVRFAVGDRVDVGDLLVVLAAPAPTGELPAP
jgi:propionyl-CoA carboxylase alpha chain